MRITTTRFGEFVARAVELADDPGLGLELGLELKASSHGMLGLALMTCDSLRSAIALGERYMQLRAGPWRIELQVEGDTAVMRFVEQQVLGRARSPVLEAVLGATIRIGEFMLGIPFTHPEIEFRSDSPERPHHVLFRDRLPRVRYNCATNEARFPASWLDQPLVLRDPVTNREAVTALEHERRLFMPGDDLFDRTRAVVGNPSNGFPDLEHAARRLGVSTRTLRRHLSRRGMTFQALRDEVRSAHSITLLERTQLAVAQIAHELGYADSAGFVRAFQRWTGETPSVYRQRVLHERAPRASNDARPARDCRDAGGM